MWLNVMIVSVFLSIFLIVYHHALYPIILRIIELLGPQEKPLALGFKPYQHLEETQTPFISIFIPAYNEQQYIIEKLNNLACLDYPRSHFEIVVACDGCSDQTAVFAKQFAEEHRNQGLQVRVLDFKSNRGKCAVINKVVPELKGEIVALTDVSALVSIDALRLAQLNFCDPSVGAINGNYRFLNPGSAGEENYWQYQSRIKRAEQGLGSVLGAHGAFYCMRRKLFRSLPNNTINDDFIIPMRIVEQGYRVVYESRINALEMETSNDQQNWQRRQRIGMGNVQQIIMLRKLFKLNYSGVAFAFLSGKGLRVLMPVLMIYAFLASGWLSFHASDLSVYTAVFFKIVFWLQMMIYLMAAIVGLTGERFGGRIGKTIFYLVSGHLANFLGACRYIFQYKTQW